jgi:hypothetical protein
LRPNGDCVMQTLQVDPKTGFLEQPNNALAFTGERKRLLLDYLDKAPFKIKQACEFIGIDQATFYRHLKEDVSFAQSLQAIKERRIEDVEQKLADMALVDQSVADRIFFLKAWKPDRYNPVAKSESSITITIDGNMLSQAKSERNVIEAEIVGKESANSGDNGVIISTMQGESTKGHDVQQLA